MFTPSEENYLKSLYHLHRRGQAVATNEIAERLQTKPASVTDMLKKLQAKKLIDYQPYYGAKLTAEGRRQALSIIRRHRLWEYFLVHTLGFGWDEVHEMAEQLEHVQEPRLIERLDVFLGRPAFDPHGDPIPNAQGQMAATVHRSLGDLQPGDRGVLSSVIQPNTELMQMLQHKQLNLGDGIEVKERFPFDETMELLVNGRTTVTVSFRLAGRLNVSAFES